MSIRYQKSENFLESAKKSIPLGSQTFTKSVTQFPYGVSPYFASKAKGARLWDIDGNEYIDFVNGLLAVSIGYADVDVNNAVKAQIDKGITFSLSHPLELEVSEQLIDLVPCAEMVRFGKNGTDCTSAAIRLARAYTKKDIVLVCGYHGWQDWYIGSTSKHLGVPKSTQDLTKVFSYNDFQSFDDLISQYTGRIAAVIMEPMNVEYPQPGFLEHIRRITKLQNIVLVFDETITGCRFSRGGAQELFGVTPDLATFGKGIGNGFPLSAIMGHRDIMMYMEKIFYSGTFAGETSALAAANVVLDKIKTQDVCERLTNLGDRLKKGINELIIKYDLSHAITCKGHPSWSFVIFKDLNNVSSFEIKTYFMQEMLKKGILTFGSHNLSYSHTESDIDSLLNCYNDFFKALLPLLKNGTLINNIETEILRPLFTVR